MIDLMNKTSVSVELEAIAGQLKKVGDASSADRVHQLALAVKDGMYADAWASTDVHQMIDAEAIVAQYKRRHITDLWIAWIEWIRNALIFAPLIVTWFFISRAVDAYSRLISDQPDQIREPFLFLWQQGFGQRLAWWQTLYWMATIDFVILFAVLALTVLVYSLSNGLKRRREEEADKLGGRLAHALAGATICLTARKGKQPTNVMDGLKELIEKLERRTAGLMTRIEALHTLQDSELKTSVTFRTDLKSMFTELKTEFVGLRGANTTLATNISSVNISMNNVVVNLNALLTRADESLRLLRQEINEQAKVLTEQQSWGANLKQSIQKLEKAAVTGETMANDQGKVTKQLEAIIKEIANQQSIFLTATTKQQAAQQQLESDVRALMINVQTIVKELRQCAVDLRGYTHDMNELVRRAAAIV